MSVFMLKKSVQTIAGADLGLALAVGAALPAAAQPWAPIDNTSRNNSILVEVSSDRGSCQGLLVNPTTAVVGPGCVTDTSTGIEPPWVSFRLV